MGYDAKTCDLVAKVARLIRDCAYPKNIPDIFRISEYDSIREQISNLRGLEDDYMYTKEYGIINAELDRLRELKRTRESIESHYRGWNTVDVSSVTDKITKENILLLLNGLGQLLENITYGYPIENRLTKMQLSILESMSVNVGSHQSYGTECADEVSVSIATNSDLAEWGRVISSAALRPAARKRLEILLKRLAGEKVSVLEAEYPGRNINRDLRDAKAKDVPALMQTFPTLPPLGG